MLNVSSWSIRNPIPAVMLFVLLTVAGFIAFGSMKVQNFPDLDLPTITVSASLPGAAPSQLDTDVARKLEGEGVETKGSTPQEFGRFIQTEIVKWGKVIKAAGIKPE